MQVFFQKNFCTAPSGFRNNRCLFFSLGVIFSNWIELIFGNGESVPGCRQNEICRLYDTVVTGFEAHIIIGPITPVRIGAIHAVIPPFFIDPVADFHGRISIDVFTQHDALYGPVRVRRNKCIKRIRALCRGYNWPAGQR